MSLSQGDQSKSYLSQLVKSALNSPVPFGYEKITVDGTVKNLTIPTGATYATVTIESSVTTGVVIRALQSKVTTVSTTVGQGWRDGGVFDITNAQGLTGFQVTQAQAGTHNIYVEYFK